MSDLIATREIPATPAEIFASFSDPARLARWWGPAGFTNTSEVCEFIPGGSWIFTMHGPDGHDYANECKFAEIDPPHRLVIRHTCEPLFTLTITITVQPGSAGSLLTWLQDFDNPVFAKRLEHILRPANEQNLDRLTEEVIGGS